MRLRMRICSKACALSLSGAEHSFCRGVLRHRAVTAAIIPVSANQRQLVKVNFGCR